MFLLMQMISTPHGVEFFIPMVKSVLAALFGTVFPASLDGAITLEKRAPGRFVVGLSLIPRRSFGGRHLSRFAPVEDHPTQRAYTYSIEGGKNFFRDTCELLEFPAPAAFWAAK